jgi:fluoride exporter
MNLYNLFLVGAGGMLGSIARYATAYSVDKKLNTLIPFGTLTVNIAGSFVIGMVYAWASRKTGESESIRLLVGTGFCGGFTTFSAFALENVNLFDQKAFAPSLLYIGLTLIIGFVAVACGSAIGKSIF